MTDFSKDLNPQQLSVVLQAEGPCLVLAGAGSGKTRTITYRVAHLLGQCVNPENILLLTFTNKASNEMIERIKKLTGMDYKMPWAGTFHSIANKILRRNARLLGYESNFTILDEDDSRTLLKNCIKEFKPDRADKKFPSAKVVKAIISYARNAETTTEDVLDLKYPQWFEFRDNLKNIAEAYSKQKKYANSMDFDDLLVNFLLLLNQPEVQKRYSQQFKYILVDEYQDTNKIQASVIRKLSLHHGNVLVVGDDAQSIYSFRAAQVKNILDFEREYDQAKVFKLETNYRSSQEILDVANNVIANNIKQYKKELNTIMQTGIRPALHPQMDQRQEARFIVGIIKEKLDAGVLASELAVLFRAAFHSQMLEMELMKSGIDYDYRGGMRFFDRAHVKDVLAYLRILNNLADTSAWLRVLMHEDGIGPVVAQKIVQEIGRLLSLRAKRSNPVGSRETGLLRPSGARNDKEITKIGYDLLGERAKQGWHGFVRIWEKIAGIDKKDVPALITAIKDSRYRDYLETEYIDAKERLQDIEQLAVFAEQYKSLDEFLAEASLQESFAKPQQRQTQGDRIVLSTIHQAKGLEWNTVFVINLAGGAFPSDMAWKEIDGIEEERRLFYVAITRAKKNLYFTYPMEKPGWSGSCVEPSLFLQEINNALLDDRSILSNNSIVFNDDPDEFTYISEERPNIKPGSFLVDIDDL
ncbi:MAG: UvrD-helicase domain-containing protein [bacterium]